MKDFKYGDLKNLLKYFIQETYQPLLVKYLSKERAYAYKDISLSIPQHVFHPGFFFSTKLLLQYISKLPLRDKTVLELGAGSGLISIYAAKQGSYVTASDINLIAVKALEKNSAANDVSIQVMYSDLFDRIPIQHFDYVAINPPYYKKNPMTAADYAWYCGENGEYFDRLFSGLKDYTHVDSVVLLILCDGCDIQMVQGHARAYGWQLDCVFKKQNLLEKNFIFKIIDKG